MGGSPDVPYIHMPDAIPESADLSDIHRVPAVPHGDLIIRAYLDPFSPFLQYVTVQVVKT